MRRSIYSLAVGVIVTGCCGWAHADWPTMMHKKHVDFARNNSWPQPFRGQDAYSVVAPFEIMKNNGWRDNNTVGSVLFENNALTDAGKLKVAHVLTSSPSNRRMIYVQTGPTQQDTAARVESVQLAVSELLPEGQLPEIFVTNSAPSTSPGAYQTLVHRAIQRTTPTPRLPRYTGLGKPAPTSIAPQDNK
jgi:hypothetical protein